MTRSPSLLVNYWYAHPVGHALEGMRYALGYKAANPEVHVSLLLNGATAVELARCCTFIDDVYAVPFTEFHDAAGDPAEALAGVPRSWDWVVENHRAREDSHKEMHGFRAFFHAAREHFSTRHPVGVAGRDPPAYEPHQDLCVELPADACAAAAATTGGRQALAVVLAGSSAAAASLPVGGVLGADPRRAVGGTSRSRASPDRKARPGRPPDEPDHGRGGRPAAPAVPATVAASTGRSSSR